MRKIKDLETLQHHYEVDSHTTEGLVYFVGQRKVDKMWICQCLHFQRRVLPGLDVEPCRHIKAVKEKIKNNRKKGKKK